MTLFYFPPRHDSPPLFFSLSAILSFSLFPFLSLSSSPPHSISLIFVLFPVFFPLVLLMFVFIRFPLCLSCICSCVRISFFFVITHRLAEVSSTIGRSLDTIRDRRRKHRLVQRICLRILCHRHHHHCHHSHSPIRTHCPVVVGRGAGFPSCSGSDA